MQLPKGLSSQDFDRAHRCHDRSNDQARRPLCHTLVRLLHGPVPADPPEGHRRRARGERKPVRPFFVFSVQSFFVSFLTIQTVLINDGDSHEL
jgi:hypothetical protein